LGGGHGTLKGSGKGRFNPPEGEKGRGNEG
jgi:hypothetical protein